MTDITSPPAAGGAEPGGDVLVDTGEHHHLAGAGVIKPGYAPRLTNEDLAPLRKQTWGSYNFFAFWMSEPPWVCRRLHLLGRMGSCQGDRGATRRSCENVLCGWSRRSGRSMRLSGLP